MKKMTETQKREMVEAYIRYRETKRGQIESLKPTAIPDKVWENFCCKLFWDGYRAACGEEQK